MSAVDLENVRSKIDAIDKEIISLLKRRQDLVIKEASCKKDLVILIHGAYRQMGMLVSSAVTVVGAEFLQIILKNQVTKSSHLGIVAGIKLLNT